VHEDVRDRLDTAFDDGRERQCLREGAMAELPDGMQYRAFLSYRSHDRALAAWLHRKLETYRIPSYLKGSPSGSRKLGRVFRDRDDARAAHDIETTIADHLAKSQNLIVLCTPKAAGPGSWVPREIELFRFRRPEGEIHAIIGDGEPPGCIPKPLLTIGSDGRINAPLAADLRRTSKGGDGRRKAFIKLVAALIGVEFDDLWRRERRRRNMQIAGATCAVLALLTGITLSLLQRESARLGSILSASNEIDRTNNAELADLLVIAAGPPAKGAVVPPDPQQVEQLRLIGRRSSLSLAGVVAQLHQDLGASVISVSADGRLVVSRGSKDGSLFVWHSQDNRLAARLPARVTDWFNVEPNRILDGYDPVAIAVSKDARFVAAVFVPGENNLRRYVVTWTLGENGDCTIPCRPRTFSFDLPPEALTRNARRTFGVAAKLALASDIGKAIYVELGSPPIEIDFNAMMGRPFHSEIASCNQSVSELLVPPAEDIPPDPSRDEAIWSDRDGRVLARLPYAEHAISFHSLPDRREVARLQMPGDVQCINDCNIEVVFLKGGKQALIGNKDIGQFYGVLDLDQCRFDRWPASDIGSIVAKLQKSAQKLRWTIELVVASDDDRLVGAIVRADDREKFGLIYDVELRRPVSIVDLRGPLSGLGEVKFLSAGRGEFRFHALTDKAVLPIRGDGTTGAPVRLDVDGRRTFLAKVGSAWSYSEDYADRLIQSRVVVPDTHDLTNLFDFSGGTISKVAVSHNGRMLAIGQSDVVFLQAVDAKTLPGARKLRIQGRARFLQFSPTGSLLAALVASGSGRKDQGATFAVWRVNTGELLGQISVGDEDELVAILDDGRALVELSGTTALVNVEQATSTPMFKSRAARSILLPAGQLVSDYDGKQWFIDHNLTVKEKAQVAKSWQSMSVVAASADGKMVYANSPNVDGEYFLNVASGDAKLFSRENLTGVAAFSPSGKLAVSANAGSSEEIEIWDPSVPVRISTYRGDWKSILAVWFSPDETELWAVDDYGKIHRWDLLSSYATDVAAACATLRRAGRRLEFTEGELVAFPMLARQDRRPCERVGLLSIDYYAGLFGIRR
jgi:WD40 repeat protein